MPSLWTRMMMKRLSLPAEFSQSLSTTEVVLIVFEVLIATVFLVFLKMPTPFSSSYTPAMAEVFAWRVPSPQSSWSPRAWILYRFQNSELTPIIGRIIIILMFREYLC